MTTAYTSLLGLALPVTGELSGTWGDTVNNGITSLVDSAVAGTTNVSTDADVTLTTTTGAANTAREAILLFSGARTLLRTVTAPAQSKIYTVINATTGGFAVKLVGAGPTTGLTIPNGASAVVAWNGSDFVEIGAGSIGNLVVNGTLTVTGATTLQSTLAVTGNITNTAGTANGVAYLNGSKVVTSGSALTFDGTGLGIGTGTIPAGRKLVIDSGNIRLSNDYQIEWGGSTVGLYGNGSTNSLSFFANTSEQMRLTSTGLGIGTSSPSQKLDVNGNITSTAWIGRANGSAPSADCAIYRATDNTLGFSTASTERMRLDSSGNLGIGTSSPNYSLTSYKAGANANYLQVANGSTGAGSGNGLLVGLDASGNGVINAQGAVSLLTTVAGVLRTTLDSSGNLGLGVTPSATSGGKSLEIGYVGSSVMSTAAGQMNMTANVYYNAGWKYAGTGTALLYQQSGTGVNAWYTAASGTAGNAITFTQAMTLDASGNLMVGTTSTSSGLTLVRSGSDSAELKLSQTGTSGRDFRIASTGSGYGSAGNLIFYDATAGAERARIDSSGNLLVGTTSGSGARLKLQVPAAGTALHSTDGTNGDFFIDFPSTQVTRLTAEYGTGGIIVFANGTSKTERARIDSSGNLLVGTTGAVLSSNTFFKGSGASNPCLALVKNSSSSSTDEAFVVQNGNAGGTTSFQVLANGNAQNTNNSYGAISDVKLKENIVDATPKLDDLLQVKIRQYNLKSDEKKIKQIGVVAQELETVFPSMIEENSDGIKSVKYSVFIPMLIKALQEQQAIINQLKARLDAANL